MSEEKPIEQEIRAKGLTAPRVTPADVEASIASTFYFTAAQGAEKAARDSGSYAAGSPEEGKSLSQVTFCVLILRNGTKIAGVNYGSIEPAQHSAERGREDARAQAVEQIWPLLGYELRSKLTSNTPT